MTRYRGDMEHLVIVAPLEPLIVGASFAVSRFPLHLTLVPPFLVDCALPALNTVIEAISNETERLLAEVTGRDEFGPNGDIVVAVIRPTGSILKAHTRLTAALMPLGWSAQEPHYNGQGFRPHITSNDDGHVRLGEHFILGEIAIVEMLDLPIVRATYVLSDFRSNG